MRFSVIVATRDRPALLARALRSIAAQRFRDFDVIVADDSSDPAMSEATRQCLSDILPTARCLAAPASQQSRGPSASRNRALAHASGQYVAFLDDDDEWSDPTYLTWLDAALSRLEPDLHLSNQVAIAPDGHQAPGPIWIEDLGPALARGPESATITVAELLQSHGFAHLNTLVARRSLLWDVLGGFDETLRYEEDRDLYYRLVDRAARIAYAPRDVARHYVPAGTGRTSASVSLSTLEKLRDRARSMTKLAQTLRHPDLVARVQRERGWALRRIACTLAANGDRRAAQREAFDALRARFGWRWLAYTLWLTLRRAVP